MDGEPRFILVLPDAGAELVARQCLERCDVVGLEVQQRNGGCVDGCTHTNTWMKCR